MCLSQIISELGLLFLKYIFIGDLYFFSIFFCWCFSYGFIKTPYILIRYQPHILDCRKYFCSLTYVLNMFKKFQLRIYIMYSFCMCTVLPSYPWFCFPWFRLVTVDQGPEADDPPVMVSEGQQQPNYITMPRSFPSLHLILQASHQLSSSQEEE